MLTAAQITLEQRIRYDLLWSACHHHVGEKNLTKCYNMKSFNKYSVANNAQTLSFFYLVA